MDWLEKDKLTSWFWTMGRGCMFLLAMVLSLAAVLVWYG